MEHKASIVLKIKSIYPSLKPSEKRVADYILSDTENFIYGNLAFSAKAAGVSEATFVRFCKNLGFEGYRDLHIAFAASASDPMQAEDGSAELSVDETTCFADIPSRVIARSVCALNNLNRTLCLDAYTSAVERLESANHICVFGAGSSAYAGRDFANKLMRLGKFVQASADPHDQVNYAVTMGPGDAAIGFTHSGRTKETVALLQLAKEQGATVICITNYENSAAAALADIVLLTASHEKMLQSETMVSRLSQLAIADMLFWGLVQRNYAKYAPLIEQQNATVVRRFFLQGK